MLDFTEKIEPDKILKLLSRGLPYYLKSWHDLDEQRGLFGSVNPRSYNMSTVGSSSPVIEYVLRPHINVLIILSCYIYLNKTDSIKDIISKEELVIKLNKGIRWVCDTHITGELNVETFLERRRWGENWRSSLWASLLGAVSVFAGSVIDKRDQRRIREIIAHEANRFIDVTPPSGCYVDTKLEENAQDAMIMAWAINICPIHQNVKKWEESLKVWSLNIASSVHDSADHSEYFGASVSRTVTTCNLFYDFTAENHGFFHPEILSYGTWITLSMAAYALHKQKRPSCFERKNHQRTYDILMRFCLPNGMLFAPGGHDLPLFTPHPFAFAWGLWHSDPKAMLFTGKLLSWMDTALVPKEENEGPWVFGFEQTGEGWELFFQSQAGAELALLACLPFPKEERGVSAGLIENAIDTRHIYPYIEICYRRNVRSSRSMAWKAIGAHPMVNLNIHCRPELLAPFKAAMLGIPSVSDSIKYWEVLFHNDTYQNQKAGFDSSGRIVYYGASGKQILTRDLRVLTWGEEGILVLDQIKADADVEMLDQYLSPIYLVNDHWTNNKLELVSGSLKEEFTFDYKKYREVRCPVPWANIENELLLQFIWGNNNALYYLPGGVRNAPPYWKNCRLDMLAIHAERALVSAGNVAYSAGFYIGGGKGSRSMFKTTGSCGEFFKGLVVMDGRITMGLE